MKKIFILVILAICMCFHTAVNALGMAMDMNCTEADGIYSVKISVSGNTGICAGSFEIAYNGEAFDLKNLSGSNVFEGAMLELNEEYSKDSAKVSFISVTPISGDGELISFDIIPKLPDVKTEVAIKNAMFADSEENVIECNVNGITINTKSEIVKNNRPSGGSLNGGVEKTTKTEISQEQEPEPIQEISDTYSGLYFSDIDSHSWAKEQILFLAENKIVSGVGNGKYSPSSPIKRGDFICMLMRMLKLDKTECEDFEDVDKNDYWYESIMLAKGAGIAYGYDNKFNPRSNITRQDMFTLVCRAYGFKAENADNTYLDSDLISNYAKESISIMSALGFIKGSDGYIKPLSNATRAETAVMLYNIYISNLKEE